jgi:hypothetical protein
VRDTSGLPGAKMLDPACGMIVDIADSREHGLMKSFAKAPHQYRAKVDAWVAAQKR